MEAKGKSTKLRKNMKEKEERKVDKGDGWR